MVVAAFQAKGADSAPDPDNSRFVGLQRVCASGLFGLLHIRTLRARGGGGSGSGDDLEKNTFAAGTGHAGRYCSVFLQLLKVFHGPNGSTWQVVAPRLFDQPPVAEEAGLAVVQLGPSSQRSREVIDVRSHPQSATQEDVLPGEEKSRQQDPILPLDGVEEIN